MSTLTVQQKLRTAGFDPGPLDGLWGRRTELALDTALAAARGTLVATERNGPAAVLAIIGEASALTHPIPRSPESDQLQLAISGQEAAFEHRWQVIDLKRPEVMGPARGLWQFERGGGVKGVLTHERTRTIATNVCRMRKVPATIDAVYNALHSDDILAAAFARLLIYSSPTKLPAIGDVDAAWAYYLREWRPGAYTRGTTKQREELRAEFGRNYAEALRARG